MKKNFYSILKAIIVGAIFLSSVKSSNAQSIITGPITGSPFCQGATVSIPYTITGGFNLGNVFTAQLSDATGSFAAPTSLGVFTSTGAGTITGTISLSAPPGTGYRIRVLGSNPFVTGSDNGVDITINASPIAGFIQSAKDTVCSGTPAMLDLAGGSGSGVIQWQMSDFAFGQFTDIPGATSQQFFDLPVQSRYYRVYVSDGTCSDTSQPHLINTVNTPIAQFTYTTSVLDAQFVTNATGDVVAYQWDFGDGGFDTQANPFHTFPSAGSYQVCLTVYNGAGCSFTLCQNVLMNGGGGGLNVTETHNDATCGNTDGLIVLTVTGGVTPYTYLWSNGATTKDLNNIGPGTYTVMITDSAGLQGFAYAIINNPNAPYILAFPTGTSKAGASDGYVYIYITGGMAPYTYLWNNGATGDSLTGLSAGIYEVSVTDANGCVATQLVKIIDGGGRYFYVYATGENPNCASNGSVTANVYGGTAPFTYLWNTSPPQTTQTADDLGAGDYYVTVTDSTGTESIGFYTLTTSCNNIVTGFAYNDVNGNCIYDTGDSPLPYASVTASDGGGKGYYGYTDYTGIYTIYIPESGTFNLTGSTYTYFQCGNLSACGNSSVTFTGLGDTVSNINFGFKASSGYDLTLHPGWSSANPGFDKEYWILAFNQSYTPFTGAATVTFKYDPSLIYQYSFAPIPVHNAAAHTLTWVLNSIPSPFYDWDSRLRSVFKVPASLPLSYLLQTEMTIVPKSGDCDSTNNVFHSSEVVTGSLDPNEKDVTPSGDITNNDSTLTYSIHFQNTGNDTTHFVIVRDTLSPYLDPTTVRTIAFSHPYEKLRLEGTGILSWTFNPIFLVDSATNEPESKGFVTFTVKKKPNLPLSTQIDNTASIYFDYNTPVVTNTVKSKIISSVKEITADTRSVSVFPNPFTASSTIRVTGVTGEFDFELYNVLGKKVMELKNISSKEFTIQRNKLSSGIYFLGIKDSSNQLINGKMVIE